MEPNTINSKTNYKRTVSRILCVCMLLSVCCMTIPVTYAAEGDPTVGNVFVDMVTDMSSQLYTTMRALIIPIIACFVGWAGFCALTGGARGVEQCVSILKKCFAAACLVAFAPLLAQQVGMWVKDSGAGDLGSYNPLA